METKQLEIKDIILLKPKVFPDNRGYFYESYNINNYLSAISGPIDFVQDNLAYNDKKNTIRGLHYQEKYYQSKLVSCIKGSILDVVVDVREDSDTFGKWASAELSEYNNNQLWIPKGFAHGYRTLEDNTVVIYKADEFYNPDDYRGFIWNDEAVDIDWGLEGNEEITISEQDENYGTFNECFGLES